MSKNLNFYFYCFYAGLFALLALLFAVMAHYLVGLSFEGSHWFFEILTQHKFVYAAGEWRWSDSLWQVPAYFSLNWAPWVPFKWNLYILSYSYTLYPLAGILLSYFIVRKEKKVFLYMAFPLLSFASAVAISLTFVVGIANGAVTIFWPLFFILLFRNLNDKWYFLLATFLLFPLNFNYDLAVIFFPLLVFAILQKNQFKPDKNSLAFLGLIIISFALQMYRLLSRYFGAPEDTSLFLESLFEQPNSSYIYAYQSIILVVFFAGLQLFAKLKRPVILWIGAFLCFVIGVVWFYKANDIQMLESRHNRMASIFLAWIIAASLLYFKKFLDSSDGHQLRRYIISCSAVCVLMSLIFNIHCFDKWTSYRSSILNLVQEEKGCIFVNQLSQMKSNAFVSLLLQESKTPQSILLTSDRACIKEFEDPCRRYLKEEYPVFKCRYLYLTGYNMDLSATKTESKRKVGPFLLKY